MKILLDKIKELLKKGKELFKKLSLKQKGIIGIAIVAVVIVMLCTGNKTENYKVAFANVSYPKYSNDYIFQEVDKFKKIEVSNIKFQFKKNNNSINKERFGFEAEYEFTIKNTSKEAIKNVCYQIFYKDPDGKMYSAGPLKTFDIEAGQKYKVKVNDSLNDKDPDNKLYALNGYNKNYATLYIYQSVDGSINETSSKVNL